ncbi:MAG: DUF6132 family protein [bacterium]|nr:DUF6132 family protein [bacterium]
MIQKFFSKYRKQVIGASIGAALGLSYYAFIGCASGTCMITSNPFISTGYGALMGYLLIGTFKKESENEKA